MNNHHLSWTSVLAGVGTDLKNSQGRLQLGFSLWSTQSFLPFAHSLWQPRQDSGSVRQPPSSVGAEHAVDRQRKLYELVLCCGQKESISYLQNRSGKGYSSQAQLMDQSRVSKDLLSVLTLKLKERRIPSPHQHFQADYQFTKME